LKSRFLLTPLVLALSLASPGQTLPPTPAPESTDQLVQQALESNPEIRVAVRRLSLAQIKTSTAGSLDDPMLMVRDWNTPLRQPWNLNQAQVMVGLQQTFVGRDKREMRARIAGDEANIAAVELETMRQEIAAEVRKACADLKRSANEMKLHDRQMALLKEALSVALAQYSAGKVPQVDVLRAQMAVTRLSEHLIELDQERDEARARLNALRGRRTDEPVDVAGGYESVTGLPPIEELERIALDHRPELEALRRQTAKSKDEGALARLAMKPDFTVALGYMLMPSGSYARSGYMAELTMNLPRLNRERHEGEAKQTDAASSLAEAELEARANSVFLELRQAQIAVLASQRQARLYRETLMPQAESAFQAATAAYRNNRADFLNLIDSQNLLLDIETQEYKALAAADAGIAQLERAIGAPLTSTASAERTSK